MEKKGAFLENWFLLCGNVLHTRKGRVSMPDDKHESSEVILCPYCKGYGYLEGTTIPGPCVTCGASGWLTESELAEWEKENKPVEWMDEC